MFIALTRWQAQGGCRLRGNTFPASGEAELFGGRRPLRRPCSRRSRKCWRSLAYRVAVWSDLRGFADDVVSRCAMTPPLALTRSTAKARKRSEDAPRHCGSLGGKCEPMSPSARAPRIASVEGVEDDIGIGMAGQSAIVRDLDATEYHSFAVREGVDVVSPADARFQHRRERRLRLLHILRGCQLHVGCLTFEDMHGMAAPFDDAGIVSEIVRPAIAARRCASSSRSKRKAWGV